MPKITVTMPDGTDVTHELTENVTTVGRISDNTIQIEDASVSSHHAEITLSGDHHFLTDLDSTNGTRVNDHGFTKGNLHDGDIVSFGNIHCVYASENPANARPLPQQESHAVAVGATSSKPQDFSNASPFKTKTKKKDPIATSILAFAGFAVLVFAGAMFIIFTMQAPMLP
jgi:pSer/pThr/pTyr-binding forkhead associated (FHA) protein